ncbi:serine hydrolase domain-containing protein [Zavarzinia sp. CC-PAN008]|uniref:serine hydrolase domain-containing protein n=1 Tax=Zavarzinia sp. CC-PAN008 TaxID=3243332 RepID=UPI003F74407E
MAGTDGIDAVLDSAIAEKQLVGASILVAQGGKPFFSRAVGLADREAGRPMALDTVFRLASVTKAMVTATALAMAEAGQLGLDDAVTRFLPGFTPRLPDGTAPTITIGQLLTHTSGLGYGFLQPADGPYLVAGISDGLDQPGLGMAEHMARLASVPLFFPPGAGWFYSVGIDVAGAVLERAGDAPLPELVARHVTQKLGMADTGFAIADRSRMAAAYADGAPEPVLMGERHVVPFAELSGIRFAPERIFDPGSFPSGGGGMAGTAPDFLRFLEAIRTGGAPILKAHSVATMLANQIGPLDVAITGPGWKFTYGFSVLDDPAAAASPQSRGTVAWGGVYGHSYFMDPARDLSVVAFTNTTIEGMAGPFTVRLRDAIYAALA